jgi:hypothetical protein
MCASAHRQGVRRRTFARQTESRSVAEATEVAMIRLSRFSSKASKTEDLVSPERDTHRVRAAVLTLVPALIFGSTLSALLGMA